MVVYEEARREARLESALAVATIASGSAGRSTFGESFFDRRPQAAPRLLDEEVREIALHSSLSVEF